MIDKLLDYYQRELSFIRELGSDFAARHPKIAGRLRMEADAVEDPHVSRFIEASALLAARTRLKIDDEFPDICQAILQTLYPQYLAPMPPAAIAQLQITDPTFESTQGYQVKRSSRIESESFNGEPCRFQTCFDLRLFPFVMTQVDYLEPPLPFETSPWNRDVQSAIRVRFKASSLKVQLSKLELTGLSFFLGGSAACSNALMEAMSGDLLGWAVAGTRMDGQSKSINAPAVWISKTQVEPIGYLDHESLLPVNPRSHSAYRILSEYFTANEKFRFVKADFGNAWNACDATDSLELMFYFSRSYPVLQRELDADALRINCTPIVNLFFKRAEPVRLTENVTEYRIIPNARGASNAEIYTIDRVTALSANGSEKRYLPFFNPNHPVSSKDQQLYWYAKRVRSAGTTSEDDRGTDVYLSIVDLKGEPGAEEDWTLDIETTCLNRDLVARLPFGGGQPRLKLVEGGGIVSTVCVTAPTATLRPSDRDDLHWKLISHLSLNHLVLTDSDNGAEALREILRLYNPDQSDETRRMIESVISVKYSRGTARVPGGPAPGFCRGVDVEIVLDEERIGASGAVLFAHVLDRFFGLFASINSYTRCKILGVEGKRPLLIGKPRAGDQPL